MLTAKFNPKTIFSCIVARFVKYFQSKITEFRKISYFPSEYEPILNSKRTDQHRISYQMTFYFKFKTNYGKKYQNLALSFKIK